MVISDLIAGTAGPAATTDIDRERIGSSRIRQALDLFLQGPNGVKNLVRRRVIAERSADPAAAADGLQHDTVRVAAEGFDAAVLFGVDGTAVAAAAANGSNTQGHAAGDAAGANAKVDGATLRIAATSTDGLPDQTLGARSLRLDRVAGKVMDLDGGTVTARTTLATQGNLRFQRSDTALRIGVAVAQATVTAAAANRLGQNAMGTVTKSEKRAFRGQTREFRCGGAA